jgi:predicted transcriptional regulator
VKARGRDIRAKRLEYGLSCAALAKKVGWTEEYLKTVEAETVHTEKNLDWVLHALDELAEESF